MASVAATGCAGRKYSDPPETGTLTSVQPSAWATSTAYKVDPSDGVNKVTNGGRLYQSRTDHTSSGANEPTTTSDTATWKYLGTAPNANNTVAGSLLFAVHLGRHTGPTGALAAPTDNDSGTFTQIRRQTYASFTDWAVGVYRRSTAANNKTGYATSVAWAGTSLGSGAGEESAQGFVEVSDVIVGAPSVDVHVERSSPSGGTVTGASYTLSVPSFVISVWAGIGNAISGGDLHVATPSSPLVLVGNVCNLVSYSIDGYFQWAVAAGTRQPGTYADVWTTTEGAQLFTLAWPLGSIGATGSATLDDVTGSATAKVLVTATGSATLEDITGTAEASIEGAGAGSVGVLAGSRFGIRVGIL